jgi:hypothetical protein
MGMPTASLLDIMRRTMANLAFVEGHASPSGPYEVTQLVNSFLGALAHPFEHMRSDLNALSLADSTLLGWPAIERERPADAVPASLGDLIRSLRNALAHGNITFLPDGNGQIQAIRLWNTAPRTGARLWGAIITVKDMLHFLTAFVALIEQRHRDFGWYGRGAA